VVCVCVCVGVGVGVCDCVIVSVRVCDCVVVCWYECVVVWLCVCRALWCMHVGVVAWWCGGLVVWSRGVARVVVWVGGVAVWCYPGFCRCAYVCVGGCVFVWFGCGCVCVWLCVWLLVWLRESVGHRRPQSGCRVTTNKARFGIGAASQPMDMNEWAQSFNLDDLPSLSQCSKDMCGDVTGFRDRTELCSNRVQVK
jgi:hypothetical protein